MSQPIRYTLTSDAITVIVNGKPHSVQKGAANFEGLRSAIIKEDWGAVPGYLTIAKGIETWAKGNFSVQGEAILFKGEAIPDTLAKRVHQMVQRAEDPSPLFKFWERLDRNTSYRSVQQLYTFLVHEGIALDEEGYLLAYKAVRQDYKDFHTGTEDNSVGSAPEMPRNKISDDPKEACHYGYHVGALRYAQSFGDDTRRIVICRVDPADVVCVPYDSNAEKMRVCKYEVIGNYGSQLPSTTFKVKDEAPAPVQAPAKAPPVKKATPPAKATKAPAKVTQPKTTQPELDLSKMDEVDLLAQPLEVLRPYAANVLKIVGASKIPGGKPALVERILEVRRG